MSDIEKLPDQAPDQKAAAPKKKNKKGNILKRMAKWFRELRAELKKVTWPTRKQVVNNTLVALVVMIVCAIGIWGFDYIATLVVRTIITIAS